jgi:hypothetical protein
MMFFPMMIAPEDSEIEVELMRPGIGELKVFPSIWGHWAGGELFTPSDLFCCEVGLLMNSVILAGPGDSKDDVKWLDDNLREFFAKNPPSGGVGGKK